MYTLPPLSTEQQAVVAAIQEGHHAKVSGVAGCGKTTTILGICSALPLKNILVLTYNARLKLETREKVDKLQLQNTEVHSYHAMCVRYYSHTGHKDDGIIDVVRRDTTPKKDIDYDIIILDECQDMTSCYFSFVQKIARDNVQKNIQFCLFGDEKQNIFSFKGSDERFLTHGQLVFAPTTSQASQASQEASQASQEAAREWKELTVHTSFRVTNQIAGFINKYLLGYDKLNACKKGDKVRYMYTNPYKNMRAIYQEVLYYLAKGHTYDDIFILAPSIKKNGGMSPVVLLENTLVKHGHPCFAPVSDEARIDEEVIRGKIVFSTFHQVKGLERPVVIIFNFDYSYFTYFGRDMPTDVCPNIIYVATTRALQNLTVIHSCEKQALMPAITYDAITQDPNVYIVSGNMSRDEFGEICPKEQQRVPVKVTELLRFLDPCVVHNAIKMLDYSVEPNTSSTSSTISLPQKAVCKKNNTAEIVYDINGYAIPAYYEMRVFKTCSLLNAIDYGSLDPKQQQNYNTISYKFGQDNILSPKYLLYISTLYDATLNGYKHRTKQIAAYDWLSQDDLDRCTDVLSSHIGTNARVDFEVSIKDCRFMNSKYYLFGRVDAIDRDNHKLWEIKCTTSTDYEHIIQLALYAWMLQSKTKHNPHPHTLSYMLLNVCKNELIQLDYDHQKVTGMIEYLLACKYDKKKVRTDSEFIEECLAHHAHAHTHSP